jgi:hypothetical protein
MDLWCYRSNTFSIADNNPYRSLNQTDNIIKILMTFPH